MTNTPVQISAHEALDLVSAPPGLRHACLDVRSEGEFAHGMIPGFVNAPILTDEERHLVGTAYKKKGQAAAVALGHELVGPLQAERVAKWCEVVDAVGSPAVVSCWRGGMRSAIACEWLAEQGKAVVQVRGGYKAMRHELLETVMAPRPYLVLAGLTGSGKTTLLQELPISAKVDLEALAAHRGSSFGDFPDRTQPSQTSFENAMGMVLRRTTGEVLLEDESATIGKLSLVLTLRQAIIKAPVIYLDVDVATRTANIFREYVALPLAQGLPVERLLDRLRSSIQQIQRRLGSVLVAQLDSEVIEAFAPVTRGEACRLEAHEGWIRTLLLDYYDKSYLHSLGRHPRPVVFRGDYAQCRQWILDRFA